MGKRTSRGSGPSTVMELPTLRQLTYGSLPYDTHPIDTYDGPQGFGPFWGPWTPIDFADPASAVSYMYGSGESNEWQFAPDYDVITVFADHSLDFAWNTSYDVAAQSARDDAQQSYTSTIANVVPNPNSSSFITRLRDALKPSQGGE